MKTRPIYSFADAVRDTSAPAFQTMVKPAGSACNLRCIYCYYLDKSAQYAYREPVMSDEVLEEYIRQYITLNAARPVVFAWHGGEPLLLGRAFYERAVALQRRYGAGIPIENTLQTNGILLDEDWCRFFADNDFLIGISLDGDRQQHDEYRLTPSGAGSWQRVMRGVALLHRFGVKFNTLSVVNRSSEGRGLSLYRFLRDEVGSLYMQFLPAVEHIASPADPRIVPPEHSAAVLAPWSVSAEGYGQFMIDIFDEWVVRDVGSVFVQMFDAVLARWCGVAPGVCALADVCGQNLVVEHNGDVYSCDHFVYPQYRLGNLLEVDLPTLCRSAFQRQFGLAKRNALPAECLACEYRFACTGGCPKHRFTPTPSGSLQNTLCPGIKHFLAHTDPFMSYMQSLLARSLPPSLVMPYALDLQGRQ